MVLFHLICNFMILHYDAVAFSNETSGHFARSLQLYSWDFLDQLFVTKFSYPPFYYYSSFPLYRLFGQSQDVAAMTNFLYIGLLLFSVYGIGRALRNPATGLLGAFIVSTSIAIYAFSRVYLLEFAVTAITALCIYLLILSQGFTRRSCSLLFGVSCGIGLLIKFSLPLYIIGPVIFCLFFEGRLSAKGAPRKPRRTEKHWNVALALAAMIGISAPWYAINLDEIRNRSFIYSGTLSAESSDGGEVQEEKMIHTARSRFTGDSFWSWIKLLYQVQIGTFYFGLFALSLLYHCFVGRRDYPIPLLWFTVTLFLFTTIYIVHGGREPRFVVPYLPAIGLLIALMITGLKNRIIRRAMVILVVIIGSQQFLAHSFGNRLPFGPRWSQAVPQDARNRHTFGLIQGSRLDPWKSREITDAVMAEIGDRTESTVAILFFLPYGKYGMSDLEMNVELHHRKGLDKRGIQLNLLDPYGFCGLNACILKYSIYKENLDRSDIVIVDNSEASPDGKTVDERSLYLMVKCFDDHGEAFELVEEFDLPEENRISIYKRRVMKQGSP